MKKRFFVLFLLFSLFIAGCQTGQEANADFNTFCMETFRSYAASDSLTLNYTLMSPKKYGITDLPDGFSSFSLHDLKQMQTSTENTLARLRSFASKNLSREDRLLYDTLDASLTLSQEDIRMLAHSYSFDPSSGIQAQLPVLLCEFILTDKQDYDQYFSLLKSIPAYFNSLISLEKFKKKKGTLPSATTIRHTIRQCQEFIDSSGTNAIEKSFEKSINSASFFSASEKKERLEKHRKLLSHSLFPAYKNLIAELGKLLPFAPNDGALAAYTGGRAYYEYLVKEKTGTISSPDSLFQMLTKKLSESEQKLATLAATSPSSFLTCEKHTSKYEEPKSILTHLKKKIRTDFPALKKQTCHIRAVDSSLENFLSPAFYLTPPIDEPAANVIYINHAAKYRRQNLHATLAHEGYPGHLFQNCYFREKNKHPLRYVLNFPAYTEGYATYAEIYSYQFLDATKEEIDILQNNAISTHCLYALCDIGIHAKHWSQKKLSDFLANHGIVTADNARAIYETIIDSPGSYLPYTIGYLEICRIRDTFQKAAGKYYSPLLFHTFLLDTGPTSFPVLERQINGWLKEKT